MIPPTAVLPERSGHAIHDILGDARTRGIRLVRVRRTVGLHDRHLVLVAREDRVPLADLLWNHGFHRQTPRGRLPIRYSCERGLVRGSTMVDVTFVLRYGNPTPWLAGREQEAGILERARIEDGVPVVAPEDEVVDILLHCLLDLGAFPSRHRDRLGGFLESLRRDPTSAGAVAERVQGELAPALDWGEVVRSVELERWDALLAQRSRVQRHLLRRAPARSLLRLAWRLTGADLLSGHAVR